MNETQKAKLFDLCRRSKRGLPVSNAEHRWAQKMFNKYPVDYGEIANAGAKQAIREYLGPFAPGN